jgi:hypothetical protein
VSVQPNCVSLIICDTVIEDARTRNKSLISMFNGILAQRVPARHDKMCAFVALTGGRGRHAITLRLCYDKTYDTDLLSLQGEVDFPAADPHAVVDLVFEIRGFVFPEFGNYTFEVMHESVPLLTRRFSVNELPSAVPPAG